ncbi:MAG: flagellar hook-basal body complex protein FliE [Alphaproteobacteria bacterium]|nr:MAG: flagellar hook-basal body complex protein FliE [Alphaproteobacteria bacterium]
MIANINSALSAYRNTITGGEGSSKNLASAATEAGDSFGGVLAGMGSPLIGALKNGEKAMMDTASGKGNLAALVSSLSEADIMLQTVSTVRDKAIQAYQDIMHTAI